MKKKTIIAILAGVMALSVCACGGEKPAKTGDTKVEDTKTEDTKANAASEEALSAETVTETDEDFSFADLKNQEFWFCSGAGGWATIMTVDEDGSFSGEYFDGEMGDTGEGYPNGTTIQCDFNGQFTQPEKVNDYTYSVEISELTYEKEPGTEEIKDGVRYCYSDVYGLDGAENILIYLPGAPLAELSEEFRSWVGYYDLSNTEETRLPFYALNNEAQQYGFYSYDIIENVKDIISRTEEWAASLEESMEKDPLSQAELNEKSAELYSMWDRALNELWDVLKQTQEEETMNALTEEEREWIAQKEQAVNDAGAEAEGGSLEPLLRNDKAAELTKARVYELLELLK